MKLPRNLGFDDLTKVLKTLGYNETRQTGSHIRLTTVEKGEHHITIPKHKPLRVGTLASILSDVAAHFKMTRDELYETLFGKGKSTP